MTTINKIRRIIPEDRLDDWIDTVKNTTTIQLDENYWVSIKNYNPNRANDVLNCLKHKKQAISTRKRLLEKLNAKYDVKRISATDKEFPIRIQGGISGWG
jgi:hypothetical protein